MRKFISWFRQGGWAKTRWRLALIPLLLGSAALGWRSFADMQRADATNAQLALARQALLDQALRNGNGDTNATGAKLRAASLGKANAPIDKAGEAGNINSTDPRAQLALWNKRLQRAQEVLDNYRAKTIYPHESRPIADHADQAYPNQPIVEEKKLYRPGDDVKDLVRLRTSQERIYVAGAESVVFTIAALDQDGNALPLTITQALAFDPPRGNQPSKRSRVAVGFNDGGVNGDASAGDGVLSTRFQPSTQGFDNYTGAVRLELFLKVGEQTGFTFFDMYFSPDPPAVWTSAIREAIESGSLNLYLQTNVRSAGRYVAAGRIDDANGQPFAYAVFNDELGTGAREIKLTVFGKLIHDKQPVFPLRLRDVDAFLLNQDADPDRVLMPRKPGLVYTTKKYAVNNFSASEWQSEERERYLQELANDVAIARARVEALNRTLHPPGKG
jgi:hypothetical protein